MLQFWPTNSASGTCRPSTSNWPCGRSMHRLFLLSPDPAATRHSHIKTTHTSLKTTHTSLKTTHTSLNPAALHLSPPEMFFPCPECARSFRNLSGLRRHQNAIHRDDPGLSVPVAELRRVYHPKLTSTYITCFTSLHPYCLQAVAVIRLDHLFHQMTCLKFRPSRQVTIGCLFHHGQALSLRNLCTPMLSSHRERSIGYSNSGPPRLSTTASSCPSVFTNVRLPSIV